MPYIFSIGQGIPKYTISQDQVKVFIKHIFPFSERKWSKILPIFDNAAIHERQLAVGEEWLKKDHTFAKKNKKYQKYALQYALNAVDHCLTNENMLSEDIPYEAIDMIMFISSTGISTPSLDAFVMNERPFRNDVVRMPLWGLGCSGGTAGLARASDWLIAHPEKLALVIGCELCSLTFQKNDLKMSNVVGTALFGDGVAAALVAGDRSPYLTKRRGIVPKIMQTSCYTAEDSLQVMGWEVTNQGFEVIFSKSIPKRVKTIWKEHLTTFLNEMNLQKGNIHSFIAHPGGRKVLEAMEHALDISREKLHHSYNILKSHGNMSSATVLYVLKAWMHEEISRREKSILSSLGPGFSSNLILVEWD